MGKELGTYLREMRKDSKITVPAMVKATGVSKSMITYIESGKRYPGFAVMLKYASAVGVLDIAPMIDIYLREQVNSAITELKGTGAEKLVKAWLDKQANKDVLSVDIAKRNSKVCGQIKTKQTNEEGKR